MIVYWSEKAEWTFNEEVDFIFRKWGNEEVEKFILLVEDFIEILESGMLIGRVSNVIDARFSVISKQTTLVYRVDKTNNRIELLMFWNNKRNPNDFAKYLS